MRTMRATGAALLAALAIVTLSAAPAAADTVGYTGVVRDPDGNPVANACLALHTSATDVAAEHCSDASGRYTIPGAWEAPDYKIRVHAEGFRTEWWYGAPDYLNADPVSIPAGSVVERDVTLGRGAGSISGRITDQYGTPVQATVTVHGEGDAYEAIAYTSVTGTYQLSNLPPGGYRISVYDNQRGVQWVPRKEIREEATVFTVADGDALTVNEWLLPLGTVKVVVTDAVTALPVPRPCVYVHGGRDESVCGVNGIVDVLDVRPGTWELDVSAGASYFPADPKPTVDVVRGQVTRVGYQLRPGAAVATTVLDAASGQPVGGICAHLVQPRWGGQSAHMRQYCSADDGHLEAGPFEADELGTWQLYAFQPIGPYDPPATRYGAQWVTANGGSGDQREALPVTLRAKETVTIPPIRVDPPGRITGTIRNAAGAAVSGVCAYPFAFHPGQGAIFGANCSNAQGQYTLSDLGPYRWPVEFAPSSASGYSWQWSGDVADRFAATLTKVGPGATATVDARLATGGVLAGKVTDGASPVDAGYVWTYNARTGDIASASYANIARDGTFAVRGHRTQEVYVEYWSLTKGCWYAPGGRYGTKVAVTAGATTTIAANMSRTCGLRPYTAAQSGIGTASGPPLAPIMAAPTRAGR
ncbi:carboxypeptidase-like regulatory domain-containing protein [Micromonospora sp. NPDC048909]|uniref:carboxypeptidase-like regulatory domain-containing protein n=1 Tax=Micromonospora sp. NPDC048909 TaxID=3155643 RepID=UPI0033E7E64B